MDFSEVLEKLSDEEKQAITDKLEVEKRIGMQKYQEKDAEMLDFKEGYKKLGWTSETPVTEFSDSLSSVRDELQKKSEAEKTVSEELAEIKATLAREQREKEELVENNNRNTILSKLTKEFDGYEGKDLLAEVYSSRFEVSDKGVVSKEGTYAEVVKGIKEERIAMAKNPQASGTEQKIKTTEPEGDKSFADYLLASLDK